MARPRKEINWDVVDKLCALQCTLEEIAGFCDCSADTIERACKDTHKTRFAEYYKTKQSTGKISLRRYQWKQAEKGSVAMLIWLGKQMLGQSDRVIPEGADHTKLDLLLQRMEDEASGILQPQAGEEVPSQAPKVEP